MADPSQARVNVSGGDYVVGCPICEGALREVGQDNRGKYHAECCGNIIGEEFLEQHADRIDGYTSQGPKCPSCGESIKEVRLHSGGGYYTTCCGETLDQSFVESHSGDIKVEPSPLIRSPGVGEGSEGESKFAVECPECGDILKEVTKNGYGHYHASCCGNMIPPGFVELNNENIDIEGENVKDETEPLECPSCGERISAIKTDSRGVHRGSCCGRVLSKEFVEEHIDELPVEEYPKKDGGEKNSQGGDRAPTVSSAELVDDLVEIIEAYYEGEEAPTGIELFFERQNRPPLPIEVKGILEDADVNTMARNMIIREYLDKVARSLSS